jgi:Icc-related predicted phosphoesterase
MGGDYRFAATRNFDGIGRLMGMLGKLFGAKPAEPVTRLFFASDLHGSERTFRKFINAAKIYQAQALVMGGDVVGKVAIPIIREASANGEPRYRAYLMGRTEHLEGAAGLARFTDNLGTLGYYGAEMDEDEYLAVKDDKAAIDRIFASLALRRLTAWMELADERLAGTGVKLYMMGGNDDEQSLLDELMQTHYENVVFCENRAVEISEHHVMVSAGVSTPTPWATPREMPEDELATLLAGLVEKVSDPARAIFNFHVPPVDSTLDTCPQLDWTTDPPSQIVKSGQAVLFGAGSQAVRGAIETHQPMLSLHGHIHESGGVTKIGRTTAINPGSEYGEGILRGCIITLGRDSVKSTQMTSG